MEPWIKPERLTLPQVTICTASSVNIDATIAALEASLDKVSFADCILFTNVNVLPRNPLIRVIQIGPIQSGRAYSEFLVKHLADFVETSHCLIVQWDGHVLNAENWDPCFLEFDYIGARWPQFGDGYDVGNGGFSLRSRRLLLACQSPRLQEIHPEDTVICRTYRNWFESQGLRFADCATADRFSAERAGDLQTSFGFHGIWHMPQILGADRFWQFYCDLDDRTSAHRDVVALLKELIVGNSGLKRALRLLANWIGTSIKKGN